jgi:Zn-dependent alcohol dehydrogenase
METMRALVVARYGGQLELANRPLPRPGPGEVLVRVRASGLCATDMHLVSGRMPLGCHASSGTRRPARSSSWGPGRRIGWSGIGPS